MIKTRFSIFIALALLLALFFSLRQSNMSRAKELARTGSQVRAGTTTGLIAQMLAVTPSVDTTVRSDQPNDNFGTADSLQLAVDGSTTKNILLYFQVENGPVPYQSIINSAVLKLSPSGGTQVVTTISARSIISDWNGIADATQWENNVTWNTKPVLTTTVAASAILTPGTDLRMDITGLYAGWLSDPGNYLNYGLELSGAVAASDYDYRFSSRSGSTSPVIEVDYTPQPTQIVISKTVGTVTLDNRCSPAEYPQNGYQFVDEGLRYSPLYIAHDDDFLYFCAENSVSDFEKRFYALYIDTDLGREARAEQDDLVFYTNPISKKSDNAWGNSIDKFTPIPCLIAPEPESCEGDTAVKLKNWGAIAGVITQTEPIEVAEYKIKLDLISVNCQQRTIGLSYYHHWVKDVADDYGWPTDRWFNQPHTWIEASFDQLPTALPASCTPVLPIPTITPRLFLPAVSR